MLVHAVYSGMKLLTSVVFCWWVYLQPLELTGKGENTGSCRLTDQWEVALSLAECCCAKFKEPTGSLLHQQILGGTSGATEHSRSTPECLKCPEVPPRIC